ncbi:hypothetical protein ACPCTO_13570 [Streptomyces olivoreticuli]
MTAPVQEALPGTESTAPGQQMPGAAPYLGADTVVCNDSLAGDGYGWLARMLPPPVALPCPRCRRPMHLPAHAPLLWQCLVCDSSGRT